MSGKKGRSGGDRNSGKLLIDSYQARILEKLRAGRMTVFALAMELDISESHVRSSLSKMKRRGRVVTDGLGRRNNWALWSISPIPTQTVFAVRPAIAFPRKAA